jgi:hypothetical protein
MSVVELQAILESERAEKEKVTKSKEKLEEELLKLRERETRKSVSTSALVYLSLHLFSIST